MVGRKVTSTPFDVPTEQALLGSLIADNKRIDEVVAEVQASDFYDGLHARIFDTIVGLFSEGHVDPVILYAAMRNDPGLGEVGGAGYLANLALAAPALPNITEMCRVLKDFACRRALIAIAGDIITQAEGSNTSAARDIADEATDALLQIGQESRAPVPSLYDTAMESLAAVEAMARGDASPRVSTGFLRLDEEIGGYRAGDFIVIMAGTGSGKSTLMGSTALSVASRGHPVIFFSLEMTRSQLVERMICDIDYTEHAASPMWYSRFRNGRLTDDEFGRAGVALQMFPSLPLQIIDDDALTIQQIGARARAFAAKHPGKKGLVLIDYLQIVTPVLRRDGTREQEVAGIARGAKALAKRLGWPVMAGSQINEGPNQRSGKDRRPQLSDARESKAIVNEADMVLSPFREAYYKDQERPLAGPSAAEWAGWVAEYDACKHWIDLLCLKNRHGRTFRDMRLWTEIGSSAIRDEEPYSRRVSTPQDEAIEQLAMGLR